MNNNMIILTKPSGSELHWDQYSRLPLLYVCSSCLSGCSALCGSQIYSIIATLVFQPRHSHQRQQTCPQSWTLHSCYYILNSVVCCQPVTYCSTRGMLDIGVKVAFFFFQNKLQPNCYFSLLGRGLTKQLHHIHMLIFLFSAYWLRGDGTF